MSHDPLPTYLTKPAEPGTHRLYTPAPADAASMKRYQKYVAARQALEKKREPIAAQVAEIEGRYAPVLAAARARRIEAEEKSSAALSKFAELDNACHDREAKIAALQAELVQLREQRALQSEITGVIGNAAEDLVNAYDRQCREADKVAEKKRKALAKVDKAIANKQRRITLFLAWHPGADRADRAAAPMTVEEIVAHDIAHGAAPALTTSQTIRELTEAEKG